ncbi:tripartite tricarboxylate transporter TctB family protein [Sinorhizobium medicae]
MTDLASGTITIKKDVVAGVFIAAFAIGFGAIAWNYSFGNVSQMGPGFFPLILSAVLGCLGLAVAVRGIFSSAEQMTFVAPIRLLFVLASPPPLRGAREASRLPSRGNRDSLCWHSCGARNAHTDASNRFRRFGGARHGGFHMGVRSAAGGVWSLVYTLTMEGRLKWTWSPTSCSGCKQPSASTIYFTAFSVVSSAR